MEPKNTFSSILSVTGQVSESQKRVSIWDALPPAYTIAGTSFKYSLLSFIETWFSVFVKSSKCPESSRSPGNVLIVHIYIFLLFWNNSWNMGILGFCPGNILNVCVVIVSLLNSLLAKYMGNVFLFTNFDVITIAQLHFLVSDQIFLHNFKTCRKSVICWFHHSRACC